MSFLLDTPVTIRPSRSEDAAGIRRLAALDSAPVPRGRLLLAEAEGRLLAAVPIPGGRAIADPFVGTLDVVAVLRGAARRVAS
jgi:hypothetical protein